ncbi:hypothetical protein BURPS668_A0996 [Burkholderia pseudomallei 668]|nr:hypothetical protein BURPS668_A0996 [Burkholderia pseudomallei 668]
MRCRKKGQARGADAGAARCGKLPARRYRERRLGSTAAPASESGRAAPRRAICVIVDASLSAHGAASARRPIHALRGFRRRIA